MQQQDSYSCCHQFFHQRYKLNLDRKLHQLFRQEDELYAQPGLRGKMRRAGYVAGAYGAGLAKKLGRKISGK